MKFRHYFLTGLPFIGKTTALLRIIQSLGHAAGFITLADERDGKRTGLKIITSGGQTFHIATVEPVSQQRIGKYSVDLETLNDVMQQVLHNSKQSKYVYIDPIGTLYCQSHFFIESVRTLFESHTVIGVITRKGHGFIHEIHQRQDCSFTDVTAENRDDIPGDILKRLA